MFFADAAGRNAESSGESSSDEEDADDATGSTDQVNIKYRYLLEYMYMYHTRYVYNGDIYSSLLNNFFDTTWILNCAKFLPYKNIYRVFQPTFYEKK